MVEEPTKEDVPNEEEKDKTVEDKSIHQPLITTDQQATPQVETVKT